MVKMAVIVWMKGRVEKDSLWDNDVITESRTGGTLALGLPQQSGKNHSRVM